MSANTTGRRMQATDEAAPDLCPICAEPLKDGDTCATDIELGTCHAECLDGSPTVDLETGKPVEGSIPSYPYEATPNSIPPDTECHGSGAQTVPGFWMHETSGVLRPAVEAYLTGAPMTREQIAAMRAYLRQWIFVPCWRGRTVRFLRRAINDLTSREGIRAWLALAEQEGIDPL